MTHFRLIWLSFGSSTCPSDLSPIMEHRDRGTDPSCFFWSLRLIPDGGCLLAMETRAERSPLWRTLTAVCCYDSTSPSLLPSLSFSFYYVNCDSVFHFSRTLLSPVCKLLHVNRLTPGMNPCLSHYPAERERTHLSTHLPEVK